MPLSVNVGLNRKASQDFQSTGASINITAELDATLLTRPDELQAKIVGLYQQARIALDRQAVAPAPAPSTGYPQRDNGHDGRPANGYTGNGNGKGRGGAPLAERQKKAIVGIARQQDVDPYAAARQTFGCDLNELRAWQASKLIDSLKSEGFRVSRAPN